MTAEILDKVRKTVEKYSLLEKGDKVLVACSGGADSTALLLILQELKQEYNLALFLGHFNHKLRTQADKDEAFVRRLARQHSLRFFLGSEDVRCYAKKRRMNLEEAGRILRYDFLRKTARKMGGIKIATGHTMNDQAETFFMRIIRGSGMRGLAGIFPIVDKTVIRPLLHIERGDVEEYLKERGAAFCVDESNFDRRYLRNRIRLELIPFIQKKLEPKIIPQVSRIVSILHEEEAFLEHMAERERESAFLHKKNSVFLKARYVSTLPRALARRIAREFIAKAKGDLRRISFEDVEAVLDMAEGKRFSLKEGLDLLRSKGLIFPHIQDAPQQPYEYHWDGKEPLEVRELDLEFSASMKKQGSCRFNYDDEKRVFVDGRKLVFPLIIRNKKEGDRYHPLGAPGKKKLKEIMRAKGIPTQERKKRPVFLSGKDIVWVLGLPVSEKYKVCDTTKDVFMIQKKESREKGKSEK